MLNQLLISNSLLIWNHSEAGKNGVDPDQQLYQKQSELGLQLLLKKLQTNFEDMIILDVNGQDTEKKFNFCNIFLVFISKLFGKVISTKVAARKENVNETAFFCLLLDLSHNL